MIQEVLPRGLLHLGRRFAEGVAIGGIVFDALPQIVEKDANAAVILRIDNQKVDARPIQIGRWRRLAHRDVDALHREGGEKLLQAVLELGRHLRRVGPQKKPGQLAVDLRRDGGLLFEDDGIAVAALGDRGGRRPALGALEDQDADRLRHLEVVDADDFAQRVTELFEVHQFVARGARVGVGEDLEGAGGVLHPRVRGQKPGDQREQEQAPHRDHYPAWRAGSAREGVAGLC